MQDGKTLTTDGPFVETKEAIGDLIFEADDLDAAIEFRPGACTRKRDTGRAMSQEGVEVVRDTLAAFNSGGVAPALQYLDDEIEWVGPPEWLETHLYKGHDGVREIAAQNFDEYRVDPVEFLDAGDRVIVLALQRGRIENSSVPIEDQISYVWTLRDGKGVHVQVYFTWDEALAHVGRAAEAASE